MLGTLPREALATCGPEDEEVRKEELGSSVPGTASQWGLGGWGTGAVRAQSPRAWQGEQVEELGLRAEGTGHSCALSRRGAGGDLLPCGLVVRADEVGIQCRGF